MKKFTKLFLSCAAVAALTAAIATSAMAEALVSDDGIVGTYENGTLSITSVPNAADAQETILVLKGAPKDVQVTKENVLGIDQKADLAGATIKLDTAKVTDLDNETYTVLVGGSSGEVYVATFGKKVNTVMIGDVNGDGYIIPADATLVLKHYAGVLELEGDELTAADTNGDGYVIPADATNILRFYAGDTANAGNITGE